MAEATLANQVAEATNLSQVTSWKLPDIHNNASYDKQLANPIWFDRIDNLLTTLDTSAQILSFG